ncbi:RNA pyrophosphohydrolase [Candidatus Woesearchaeota archaeon]|nr:RNA pyrophosphohydrolase [Nanoarchaeota archaeon]MCB9370071.1 RNA pyrophosphohydrolase [Candidatus Woesearchaeota archaeon]USN44602.1 MAG: RNA pyrophosphohydrolase [Candidatus Woesearchaeota archaeon]
MNDNGYRQNVAAIIINKEKKVLMCEHVWIDDAWQFPQGGVEDGETKEEALLREMSEELGTDKFKVLSKMDKPIKYQFPFYLKDKYGAQGQEQQYFLLYFYGDEKEIRFDNQEKPEFRAFEWVSYEEPPLRVIYFKKLAYLEALRFFKDDYEKFDPLSL